MGKKNQAKAQKETLFPEIQTKAQNFIPQKPLKFSPETQQVLDAGRKLFRHYHDSTRNGENYNANASLYDIKEHFQGRDKKGKMNPPQKVPDSHYRDLLAALNSAPRTFAEKKSSKKFTTTAF